LGNGSEERGEKEGESGCAHRRILAASSDYGGGQVDDNAHFVVGGRVE
jgi:hypothetical protein